MALRYVLVYAFETVDGLGIVDVGWDSDEAWARLSAGVESIGYAVADVHWAVVTHVHRDHYGLAARLQQNAGTRIAMHRLEARTLASRFGPAADQRAEFRAWMISCGVPEDDVEEMIPGSLVGAEPIPMPDPDLLLEDGDLVPFEGWQVRALWTPGHTPGHLCFVEPRHRLILAGDHVLPHITPNVSCSPRQPPNPLGDYYASLDRCAEVIADEVLPAHEFRFSGLGKRLSDLRTHHDERLQHMLGQVREHQGWTSWQLCEVGDWSRPWVSIAPSSRRLALGEVEAHLTSLMEHGRVVRRQVDGVARWSMVCDRADHG